MGGQEAATHCVYFSLIAGKCHLQMTERVKQKKENCGFTYSGRLSVDGRDNLG